MIIRMFSGVAFSVFSWLLLWASTSQANSTIPRVENQKLFEEAITLPFPRNRSIISFEIQLFPRDEGEALPTFYSAFTSRRGAMPLRAKLHNPVGETDYRLTFTYVQKQGNYRYEDFNTVLGPKEKAKIQIIRLGKKKGDYHYLFNVDGRDFPVKTYRRIEQVDVWVANGFGELSDVQFLKK